MADEVAVVLALVVLYVLAFALGAQLGRRQ